MSDSVAEMPPESAALEIEARAADPAFRQALKNPTSPAGRVARREWDQLHERAHAAGTDQVRPYASDVAEADERAPAGPGGYRINMPSHVAQENRAETFTALRESMHALGASNRFAAEFVRLAEIAHRTEWTPERLSEQRHRTETRLRGEWGAEYGNRIGRIRTFLQRRAPDFAQTLAETPLGDNEILLRRLDELAARGA